jgi:hypothetical protein
MPHYDVNDAMEEYSTMTEITKSHYSHLLAVKIPGEATHVGPSIDASWQLY